MAEPHPHGHPQQPPGTHARGNPGAPTAPSPGASAHEPAAYRTPLWGWVVILAAVAMLVGLIARIIVEIPITLRTG